MKFPDPLIRQPEAHNKLIESGYKHDPENCHICEKVRNMMKFLGISSTETKGNTNEN